MLIVALLVGLLSGCNEIQSRVDKALQQMDFNGSVLIAKDGKILLCKGYGLANFEKKIPNTSSTIFRLGSITKQFTALAILMLEEKGLLSTHDPISKYIPDYPNGDKILIHHLLTHSSGIPEHTNQILTGYYSVDDLISIFKNQPAVFSPGTMFGYCNSNYILLGYIIEKTSGLKYADFVNQNIFIPLEMKNSRYGDSPSLPNQAGGYQSMKPVPVPAESFDMSIPFAAGALSSTVEDLYKWDQALYTEKLVKKETLQKMFTPYVKIPQMNCDYGYGWFIDKTPTKEVMNHGGAINGFSALIYRDPGKHLVVILLSNIEGTNYMLEAGLMVI